MVAILLVAGLLTSACGTTSRQVQPNAADLQTIKRLAVVVTGDDPFRVVAERAEGPGKAAKAAAVGGAVGRTPAPTLTSTPSPSSASRSGEFAGPSPTTTAGSPDF
jgi:hypothetical protein